MQWAPWGILNALFVQPVVAVERKVFYRERAAGMYSALPYAFAQVNSFLRSHKCLYMTPISFFITHETNHIIEFSLSIAPLLNSFRLQSRFHMFLFKL